MRVLKRILNGLFTATWTMSYAFAMDPAYLGEWKDVSKKAYVYITDKHIIFRECGRYMILGTEKNKVHIFTGRENWCIKRGATECAIDLDQNHQLNLKCDNFGGTYQKETRYKRGKS